MAFQVYEQMFITAVDSLCEMADTKVLDMSEWEIHLTQLNER
jgi:hypothetical protein